MSGSETGFIYTLSDPRNGDVRYVGATRRPHARLSEHIEHPHSDRLETWVSELDAEGHTPDMNIINVATIDELSKKEAEALDKLSNRFELLNADHTPRYSTRNERVTKPSAAHGTIHMTDSMVELLDWFADQPCSCATIGHIADEVDYARETIRRNLKQLAAGENAKLRHAATATYRLIEDPREE